MIIGRDEFMIHETETNSHLQQSIWGEGGNQQMTPAPCREWEWDFFLDGCHATFEESTDGTLFNHRRFMITIPDKLNDITTQILLGGSD